jgi:hypothetical protein
VDERAPVDRDERGGDGEQAGAPAAQAPGEGEPAARHGEHHREEHERPHDPVGEDLDGRRGLEQRPVQREQAPQQVGGHPGGHP